MFAQKLMCSLTLRMYMHALFFPPAWSHEFLWNEHKVWKCKHLPAEEKWINSRLKEIVFSLKVNETKRERMRPDNSCWQTNGVYIMHPSRLYSFHKFWGILFSNMFIIYAVVISLYLILYLYSVKTCIACSLTELNEWSVWDLIKGQIYLIALTVLYILYIVSVIGKPS